MTTRYRLTPRAARDLDDIADYTNQRWGEDHAGEYLNALVERFESLANNPMSGRNRDDVHPGYCGFPEGSHVSFYTVHEDYVAIIGIPHKSMDVGAVLS